MRYYNNGLAEDDPITDPTIVITFEHDNVAAYGSVEVSHYEGGCTTEIVAPFGSSAIGETVNDPSAVFTDDETGQAADITPTLTGAVQTTIWYKLALLDANPEITEEILGTVTTKFCVRLSLLDDDGDEFGFREVDATITHTKDTFADVTLVTAEDETNESFDQGLGDYNVFAFFCDASATPATAIPGPIAPLTALNQGEDFTICLRPDLGVETPTSDVDILEVENCVFWVDTNPNLLVDAGETSVVAIEDSTAVDTITTDLTFGDGLVDATATVSGVHFTVTLPPPFFVPVGGGTGTTVRGLCTVLLEFQGGIVRRHLQEVGDVGEVSAPTSLFINFEGEISAEEEEEENCMEGCFLIMCIIRFIMCFMQDLF